MNRLRLEVMEETPIQVMEGYRIQGWGVGVTGQIYQDRTTGKVTQKKFRLITVLRAGQVFVIKITTTNQSA